MNIHNVVLGEMQNNSYVLTSENADRECVIIDTGLENSELISYIKDNNLTPAAVILTHGHADHIVGVKLLRDEFPEISVVIHEKDAEMLTNPMQNLSGLVGIDFSTEPADIIITEEQKITLAGIEFQIFETPGHTPGGISLYCPDQNVLFSGDILFSGSVGRSDFPGGNHNQLISTIKEKFLKLPPTRKVYPGHGYMTTISMEEENNPFLK